MPDNNSPWGSGGKGSGGRNNSPWGSGGNRGNQGGRKPQQGDLDNVIKGFKNKFGGRGPVQGGSGGPSGRGMPAVIIGAGIILLLLSCVYTVDQQEEAVVLRFGEYQRTAPSGLNFKMPTPIETVMKRKTREVQKIDIGGTVAASEMLTGDENIVDIDFSVLWRINNLENYLFNVDDTDTAVKAVAESAMREIIGKSNLEDIITTERLKVTTDVKDLMQATLDEYEAGVVIVEVQLQKADPPGEVVEAFRDVVNAAQDAETVINQATEYANKIIPEAEGTAAKIIQDAEAYQGRVTAEANGEAERFRLIFKEYKAAPRVTRQRMYLETIEEVYENSEKLVLDNDAGSGVVPYLS
ncbi:MAG: FtsH protease activity modulator HflK, partial [Desulfobacterales bacterium]|nr:FtsH protease activity modulator HflK [Desulfobacterales bacterium]